MRKTIKYKTGGYGRLLIQKVEVDRETYRHVYVNGIRMNKRGLLVNFFDTWSMARNYLVEKEDLRITCLTKTLASAEELKKELLSMEEPV